TIAAIATVPPDSDPLAWLPSGDTGADRFDHSGHFVAGNSRVLNTREKALFRHRIAVADAASDDLDPDRSGARFGDRAFHDFEWPFGASDLHYTHLCHEIPPAISRLFEPLK